MACTKLLKVRHCCSSHFQGSGAMLSPSTSCQTESLEKHLEEGCYICDLVPESYENRINESLDSESQNQIEER